MPYFPGLLVDLNIFFFSFSTLDIKRSTVYFWTLPKHSLTPSFLR
jgi:hypothetical protein